MAKQALKTVTQIDKAIRETTKTTAYPIAGYTGLEINIRVTTKGQTVADFRHRYTHPITGKRPYMTLGTYPAFTLEQARQAYNDNLALLAKGIDPLEHRESTKQAEINARKNTLQYFINEWKDKQQKKNLSPDTYRKQRDNVEPIERQLGKMIVTDIKPATVIAFINDIQKTTPYKGLAVKGVLKSILQIALIHRVIEYNPATDLVGTLTPHKTAHRPAITAPREFAKLLNDIDSLPATKDHLKEVLQMLALTFVRIGDVCSMKWADINLITKQWEFRPQKAGNRDDMTDLVTPLAPQAVAILERMHPLTGDSEYVFHNPKRKQTPYSDPHRINKLLNNQIKGISLNDGKGYLGIHTPHGFRATAKTLLMERLGYDELITELQLGHTMLNRYGRAYSRMEMINQRRAMMNDWANYLDKLKAGEIDNMIYLNNAKAKAIND